MNFSGLSSVEQVREAGNVRAPGWWKGKRRVLGGSLAGLSLSYHPAAQGMTVAFGEQLSYLCQESLIPDMGLVLEPEFWGKDLALQP